MVGGSWSLQKKKFLIVVLKAYCFHISDVHSDIISYCNLLPWFLTGYCILGNISQNTVALWVTVFCEIFCKIQFAIFTRIQ